MNTGITSFLRLNRTPTLAAAFVICLGIAPNTVANATNTLPAPTHEATPQIRQVLSHEDAALYVAIFEAQAKSFWKEADLMISHLHDKRLMGHVLADRYERQTVTLPEAQAWLAAYHDYPEAEVIYDLARKLPGASKVKFSKPVAADDSYGSNYGYGTSSGFRNKDGAGGLGLSLPARRAIIRIQSTLREGSPTKAQAMIEEAVQQGLLTTAALIPLQSRLAAGYFYNGDSAAAHKLTETSYMRDDARALWIKGLSNYQLHHYTEAAQAMVALAERDDLSNSDHAATSFWAYRALKKAGQNDEAAHWLSEAAEDPHSFYGLLASALIGHSAESAWSWRLPEYNKRAQDALLNLPEGARALALLQVGQINLAESELLRINTQGRRALQEAMLGLAEQSHLTALAMKLGGVATNDAGKPYDAALYPVPAWQPKDGYRVDRALIYALMRHESRFEPDAVSTQGACGLMQLMPATAQLMSGTTTTTSRHKKGCPDQFFDPATNIGLGQTYVRHLADQPMIGDNLLLLLAAYNGGPGRLLQRTGTEAEADPLLFMESLPAQETHDYVQQVLIQYWTYRARLRQPLQSLTQLAHGEWPRFALRDTGGVREAAAATDSYALASNMTVH